MCFYHESTISRSVHKSIIRSIKLLLTPSVSSFIFIRLTLQGNFESGSEEDSQDESYTPLPRDVAAEGDHKGTFGKCRYIYYGKHSEGNRFIVNNDL